MKYHSSDMQIARRMAGDQLRRLGAPVRPSTTVIQMAEMIAERTGWPVPMEITPDSLLPYLLRFLELRAEATPPPYRPVVRPPLRYGLSMRVTAARAAAVQPRLIVAASNVVTWRELAT
ncbi:MAG TPA: hypothetical protein VFF89_05005 [Sphingobium sp.]|nr:hypothetical protein [Sphingobium sp.]